MSKNILFKLIAIILMQALLLTQCDFALAAMGDIRDSFQEAALKFQKMTNKNTSLIFGSSAIDLKLGMKEIITMLKGMGASSAELMNSDVGSCDVNNGFYKVLGVLKYINYEKDATIEIIDEEDVSGSRVVINSGMVTRAPPVMTTKILNNEKTGQL